MYQKKAQAGLHDDDDSVPKINAIQNCVNFSHRAQNETKVLCRLEVNHCKRSIM